MKDPGPEGGDGENGGPGSRQQGFAGAGRSANIDLLGAAELWLIEVDQMPLWSPSPPPEPE